MGSRERRGKECRDITAEDQVPMGSQERDPEEVTADMLKCTRKGAKKELGRKGKLGRKGDWGAKGNWGAKGKRKGKIQKFRAGLPYSFEW